MTVLLVWLLVMSLPRVETNITVSGRQNALRCHVCEKENSFDCERPTDCTAGEPYCTAVAVRIFPRFFYVSKQCVKYCGTISPPPQMAKSFVLIKPTPFLFMACCKQDLCNNQKPIIKENIEDRYKEGGGEDISRGSSAGLVTFLTLASGLLGLRLP
ncbi:PREDICTED: lymphocyte antigen 6K-like [Lipotes vexillifer]|uniref:Lymphocyte antigen 6K-like n=1 Tax=Lipotes vexillifer TaxID=118797 RepID=A0A340XWP5_LIPVE|nr:PREDICTED: lymphocyte antigen 6K-like [Lipotes vexillifer]